MNDSYCLSLMRKGSLPGTLAQRLLFRIAAHVCASPGGDLGPGGLADQFAIRKKSQGAEDPDCVLHAIPRQEPLQRDHERVWDQVAWKYRRAKVAKMGLSANGWSQPPRERH